MDDFGTFPDATPRYGAALRSDGTWCVWDYRVGTPVSVRGDTPERQCRALAAAYNHAERARELGMVER